MKLRQVLDNPARNAIESTPRPPQPAPGFPAAGRIRRHPGRRRTLLIVDEIATNRDVLRALLAPLGFHLA